MMIRAIESDGLWKSCIQCYPTSMEILPYVFNGFRAYEKSILKVSSGVNYVEHCFFVEIHEVHSYLPVEDYVIWWNVCAESQGGGLTMVRKLDMI